MNLSVRRLPVPPTLFVLAILLLGSVFAGTLIGDTPRPPRAIGQALLHRALPTVFKSADSVTASIVDLRLPRVLLAALVGASLSVAGGALQGLLGNPLADPYTIGVSAGAAVGAGGAIVFGVGSALGGFALPLSAFGAALATMLLVFSLARVGGRVHTASFLLAGIAVGSFLWAILTLLLTLAHQEQREILNWLMGRFSDATMAQVILLAPFTFAAIFFLTLCGRGLDAFAFGEDTARSIGIEVEPFKGFVLALSALVTAAAVSFSGIIGFVGLIVPHIARTLVGPPHRSLIAVAALVGATLTVLADLLARVLLKDQELPVGVVTALIGVPVFVVLLRGQMDR